MQRLIAWACSGGQEMYSRVLEDKSEYRAAFEILSRQVLSVLNENVGEPWRMLFRARVCRCQDA